MIATKEELPEVRRRRHAATRRAVLYGLILAGGVLRLIGLSGKSFWVDEIQSLSIAQNFDLIMSYCRGGHTPPLRYFIVGAFHHLPNPEFSVRLPAVVFGALSIALLLWIGERLYDWRAGVLAAVLLLLSPWHLDQSQDARYYAVILFLALAALGLAIRIVEQPANLWRWAALAAACAFNLYLSYVAVFSVAPTVGYLAWCAWTSWRRSHDRERARMFLRGTALAALVGLLILLPWLTEMTGLLDRYVRPIPHSADGSSMSAKRASSSLQPPIAWRTSFDWAYGDDLLVKLGLQQPAVKWALLGFFGIGLVAIVRRNRTAAMLAAFWFILPWAVIFTTGIRHFCPPRYLIHYLGLYLPLAAVGIVAVWDRLDAAALSPSLSKPSIRIRRAAFFGVAAAIALAALLAYALEDIRYFRTQKQDWRSAVHFLDQNAAASDAILAGGFWTPYGLQQYVSELRRPLNLVGSCVTAPRIEYELALNPRAWYVTWGPLPPDVADVLARRFDFVGAFPGTQGIILIYRSK